MLDSLDINEAQSEAIVALGIAFEVYSEEMPDNKKDKIEAAHGIVSFGIDAWTEEDVTPSSDDEDIAEAGEQIADILKIAGIKIDKKNKVTYGKPATAKVINTILEENEIELDDEEDEDESDDAEAPVDIDDIIEGYDELTAVSRIKKIKALKLDPEDEEDYNTLLSILEWEEAQEKPASRVCNFLEELLPEEDDDEDESEEDEDDADDVDEDDEADEDEDDEDEDEDDEEELEEPWDDYDDSTVADIKKVINDDERTAEELEYVLEYEEAGEKPRATIVKLLKSRIEELGAEDEEDEDEDEGDDEEVVHTVKALIKLEKEELKEIAEEFGVTFPKRLTDAGRKKTAEAIVAAQSGDDEDEEEVEEEKPAKSSTRRRKGAKVADPDDEDDVDDAVAEDDAVDNKKARNKKSSGSTFTITFEVDDDGKLVDITVAQG